MTVPSVRSPATPGRRELARRLVSITLLIIASIIVGIQLNPMLTLILWGGVGLVSAAGLRGRRRMSTARARAWAASVTLLGAGVSLIASGIAYCDGLTVTDASSHVVCYASRTDPFAIGIGGVIVAAALATAVQIWRGGSWATFWRSFVPLLAFVIFFDPGGLGIYTAPIFVPLLVWLGWRSRSAWYRVACGVVCALMLWQVGWALTYVASG